jgi:hypothetical protein
MAARAAPAAACFMNCNNFYNAYSFHPGGAQIVPCDGSMLDFGTGGGSCSQTIAGWWGVSRAARALYPCGSLG